MGSYSLKGVDLRIRPTGDDTVGSAESSDARDDDSEFLCYEIIVDSLNEHLKCYLPRWTFPFGMSPHVVPTANH